MQDCATLQPKEIIRSILISRNRDELTSYIDTLNASDVVYLMSWLNRYEQQELFSMLKPQDAAYVIEELPEAQAVDIIEEMNIGNAAAIINEMESDERVDLIQELGKEDAEAILTKMNPEKAMDVRSLIAYDADTAGGLMITEYFAYQDSDTVKHVIQDLQSNKEKYENYHVRYIYVVSKKDVFLGVLQMQELLLSEQNERLSELVLKDVESVNVNTSLDEISDLFDTYEFYGFPVVNVKNELIGVLRRKNVMEAINARATIEHLETQGIIGGDELRSMPVFLRSKRRLSWLSVNILLNIIAASVIAFFQDTLQAVIALAVFLPIISDMSGCSGNQAVAVSMRELSLGTVKPSEVRRVWLQEVCIGLINGLALGVLIGLAAYLWKSNIYFGLVVGGALGLNTIIAVSLGGTIPLILKKFNIDPALASGPILTTVTDMIGFLLALTFASLALAQITGL